MSDPQGEKIGVLDEYGTIWNGEPGSPGAQVIGDIVPRADEETYDVYLGCDRCNTTASCKISGDRCLHR